MKLKGIGTGLPDDAHQCIPGRADRVAAPFVAPDAREREREPQRAVFRNGHVYRLPATRGNRQPVGLLRGNAPIDDRGGTALARLDIDPLGGEPQIGKLLRCLGEHRERYAAFDLQVVAQRLLAVMLGYLVLQVHARRAAGGCGPHTQSARSRRPKW